MFENRHWSIRPSNDLVRAAYRQAETYGVNHDQSNRPTEPCLDAIPPVSGKAAEVCVGTLVLTGIGIVLLALGFLLAAFLGVTL